MNATVCLVAVTMSDDSPKLTWSRWDDATLLVGYDPAWLTPALVERLVRREYGDGIEVQQGVLV